MPEKYQNKYRIPSARLQGYDYGQNGAYFITICTKNRVYYFGEIISLSDSETQNIASLQEIGYTNKFGPQSGNISSVIRGYKAAVKSFATTNKIEFGWQPFFYDRIIRDEEEMKRIRKYIVEKPDNWFRDSNNKEHLYM